MSGMMKSVGASAVVNIPTAAAAATTTQLHHSAHCFPFLSFPQHLPKLTANCVSWRRTSSVRTSVAAANSSDTVEKETESKKTYHFVVANAKFMLDDEEHFQEQLFERARLFKERNMEQDFWLVIEPKFLDKFPDITKRLKRPAVALVSTNGTWIKFMKLRLDRVLLESFEAESLEEALDSNPANLEFEKPKNFSAKEVSKTEGRVGQTTNMVIGGTVTDDSTDEWLTLDQKVNTYPTVRGFTAIGTGGDDFVQAMVVAVESVIQHPIPQAQVKQKMSSGGKYVSVNIGPIQVVSSEQVQAVYNAMRRDDRMKYFL